MGWDKIDWSWLEIFRYLVGYWAEKLNKLYDTVLIFLSRLDGPVQKQVTVNLF